MWELSCVKVTCILKVSRESRSGLNISFRTWNNKLSLCLAALRGTWHFFWLSVIINFQNRSYTKIHASFIIHLHDWSSLKFVCVFDLWNTMDYMEQMDEDPLIEFAIQMSLQDACSLSVLNEPLRYSTHKHLACSALLYFKHIPNKCNCLMQHFRISQWWKPQDFICYISRYFICVAFYLIINALIRQWLDILHVP